MDRYNIYNLRTEFKLFNTYTVRYYWSSHRKECSGSIRSPGLRTAPAPRPRCTGRPRIEGPSAGGGRGGSSRARAQPGPRTRIQS